MYLQQKYLKKDRQYIFDFIQDHPFAVFVLKGKHLLATHIPILTKGNAKKFELFGHIAHNNEQYPFLKNDAEALLIFQGPDAYVSSSWYQQKDISTWDYSAVHVNVKLSIQSEKELETSLKKLVARFEKNQKNPLFYENIPSQIVHTHLPLITGFWCEIKNIHAIAKFHQGFGKKDIDSVTQHLEKQKNQCASEVSKNIKKQQDGNH